MIGKYIFINDNENGSVESTIDNSPVSASEKIKESLITYGSYDFKPKDIASIFSNVNSFTNCRVVFDADCTLNDNQLTYLIELKKPFTINKSQKQPSIKISFYKGKKKLFSGPIKVFFDKVEKIENTFIL